MNTALWIAQILLAIAFLLSGSMKAFRPKADMEKNMAWVNDFSQTNLRLIGILEVLGALGLILPAVTGILPILTPLAASGLALIMVGAMITHLRRGEFSAIIANLVLFALAVFVAYGRFVLVPLA